LQVKIDGILAIFIATTTVLLLTRGREKVNSKGAGAEFLTYL